ncbi:MAG TPA: helix-turn-helix domain-containing protein, partial [Burkholderiaceae bacterium]
MATESIASDPAGRDFVTALARGLEVINAFGADAPEMTLSELSRRTGLSAATVRRSLITLEQLGYVRRRDRRFVLAPKVLSLGASYFASMNLREVAQHHLVDLADQLHDASSLTVLDGFEVLYIAHVPSDQRVQHGRSVGSRLPAHATSTGIVLMAHASKDYRARLLKKT